MLGVSGDYQFDGSPVAYTSDELGDTAAQTELLTVEFWNSPAGVQEVPAGSYYNNSYKALRTISDGNSFYYSKLVQSSSNQ
jgi:hypothetical protein